MNASSRFFLFSKFLPIVVLMMTASNTWAAKVGPDPKSVRDMAEQGRYIDAESAIAEALEKENSNTEKESWLFLRAWTAVESSQYKKAIEIADELIAMKPLLEEEARSLRASALEQLGRTTEALAEDEKLLKLSPNFRLMFDSKLRKGRVLMANKKLREARAVFIALERRARNTPRSPEVTWELARVEKRLKHQAGMCKWLLRLYARYPRYTWIRDWGPDLAKNEFEGQNTGCKNGKDDLKNRVRAHLWNGEDEQARSEIHEVAQSIASADRIGADELRAWYLLQIGEPDEAFKILQSSVDVRRNDRHFLMVLASAAARSGQSAIAVDAYHRIYEISGRTETARKALYQSAFLSYQFRDYDGASKRFREFASKYPKSGLARDARWNIAWISYLKGDYPEALAQFQNFSSAKSGAMRERVRYWTAMAWFRRGEFAAARPIFESMAADRSGSYYAAAATQRLAMMPAAKEIPNFRSPKVFGPIRSTAFLLPSQDGVNEDIVTEETESEETLANESMAATEESADLDETETTVSTETGRIEVPAMDEIVKPASVNSARFEKANLLLKMGFNDEARWELFEVEKRTRSKEESKRLIAAYEEAGSYNRSSYLAQVRFGAERISNGIDGAKGLWESAYPRAFRDQVSLQSKATGVPEAFLWGIMKAESQFKRDAVSPVGALGLMQVMPATGRKLAHLQKEDKDFFTGSLLQPTTAIRYGAFYLNRLGKSFDSSIPLTAAAYNAGPHRVHSWLISFGSLDMDEFIEHIPFLETREYVRKVVANSLVYNRLYGSSKDLVLLSKAVPVKGKNELSRKENWD